MLEARSVDKAYGSNPVLSHATLIVGRGEVVALRGRSGSGKSTLLHCVAGLVRPDRGEIHFDGDRVDNLSDAERSRWRLHNVGLVFQFGDLVPELTLAENIGLPLLFGGPRASKAAHATVVAMAAALGIGDVVHRRAGEVSGGQLQRGAIARALVHDPALVMADEPTGALDSETASKVMTQFLAAARERGSSVIIATHDDEVAARCDRVIVISDGFVGAGR